MGKEGLGLERFEGLKKMKKMKKMAKLCLIVNTSHQRVGNIIEWLMKWKDLYFNLIMTRIFVFLILSGFIFSTTFCLPKQVNCFPIVLGFLQRKLAPKIQIQAFLMNCDHQSGSRRSNTMLFGLKFI